MKPLYLIGSLLLIAAVFSSPLRAEDEFESLEASMTDRAVVMQLPDGVRRVRLRIREADGTWKLCTVAHLEGSEGYLKLRLPDGVAEEDLDVAASWTDPFPYSFYQGQSSFDSTPADGSGATTDGLSPMQFRADGVGDPTAETTVEESDIWKWRGDTLYFFNQYRGLQVIDVSDPAAPERLATHHIPASGEQMYLHPTADVVVLLTYDSSAGSGEVVLVKHETTDTLTEQAAFPVPGYILESRLVGTVLYVVSRDTFEERLTDADGVEHVTWRSGLAITKIDLGDPDNPVADPPLRLASEQFNYWGAQVQATPEALLIATNAYDPDRRQSLSTVHVVDISDPTATPTVTHQVAVEGQVLKKFNLNLSGEVLTVVSQVWRWGAARERHASVETFDLSGPAGSAPRLAQIEFAHNESLTATRFVGDLLYVVTFLRIDPLFVVDLADPANPVVVSELEIPGFSTHLEPLGSEALISIGVEGSQIAASWFDVSDPANPSLASRVFIGAEDGWSWTEANWDERALGFFPDDGFLLVPYQGSDPERGWVSGVQIIEIGDRELIKRGRFEHEFRARRARVLDTAVASISGRSLKTLDITDPDNPALLADLTLAWPADIVHRVGDRLVQLERGPGFWYYNGNSAEARLHVSPADDPDELTTSLDLGPGRVVGSLLAGDCLWVAQSQTQSVEEDGAHRNVETFSVTVVDLGDPDRPVITGRAEKVTTSDGYSYFSSAASDYLGEVLPDGSHVWYPAEQGSYFQPLDFATPTIGLAGAPLRDVRIPYFPTSGRVFTVGTADKSAPEILACVDLHEADHWGEGAFRLLGSTLYYGQQTSAAIVKPDGTSEWRSHHFLRQLELSDPAAPVKRDFVKLPGTFEHALASPAGGVVLFTLSHQSSYDAGTWSSESRIQALAFDGIEAFLIDELLLPNHGYGPKLFDGHHIVLVTTDYSTGYPYRSTLGIYAWLESGSFQKLQSLEAPNAVYELAVTDEILLTSGGGDLSFIDFIDPAEPDPAIVTAPSRYFWQRLELIDIDQRAFAYVPRGLWGVDVVDFEGAFASGAPTPPPTPGQNPESDWESVPLPLLPIYAASGEMPLGALTANEDWLFTNSVAVLSYEEWARAMFGLAAIDPVPPAGEDTDRDGLSNAWEYFTGTYPNDALDGARVHSWRATGADGSERLYARIPLNPHVPGNVTIKPEWSFDLDHWNEGSSELTITPDLFNPAVMVESIPLGQAPPAIFLRFGFSVPDE